jgi:xylulokinase
MTFQRRKTAQLLGIDLGTSSVKVALVDEGGQVLATGSKEYPVQTPQLHYAEQEPEHWWTATVEATRQALAQVPRVQVAGIGIDGQMHGGVLLGADQRPLGKAIIWADQRSAVQVTELVGLIGQEQFRAAGTLPAAGFMISTLRWLQQHDPAQLDYARAALLPKDYVRLRLTGEFATDASDASATGLFDIHQRQWSNTIIHTLGLPDAIWPPILDSAQAAGTLTNEAASTLGLSAGIPVATGCADQVAAALGNGLIDPGIGSISVSTGGTVVVPLAIAQTDPLLRMHTFCHAPADRWYLLGAMLCAGMALRWLRDLHGLTAEPDAYGRLAALAAEIQPGSDGLYFLPNLVGERIPLAGAPVPAAFVGLSLQHGLGHLSRAIMEGVAFVLRQLVALAVELNAPATAFYALGGGLTNGKVWRQIVTDVLNLPLRLPSGRERAAAGAALLGGIAGGIYSNYAQATEATAAPYTLVEPDPVRAALYNERYQHFVALYRLLADRAAKE